MHGLLGGGRDPRRFAAAIATCSVIAAVVGGTFLAAPADADTLVGGSSSCLPSTSLLDPTAGSVPVLGCSADSGTDDDTAATPPVGPTAQPDVPSAATGASPVPAATPSGGAVYTARSTSPTSSTLADLMLDRSSNTVYPVKDGYQDSVRFAINAVDLTGQSIAVQGTAVLSKAGHAVRTWPLDGTRSIITWNGRIGTRIERGLYTLVVTAWSADGSSLTSSAHVRVLTEHLQRHAVVVRSNVGANSFAASLPRQLLKAYAHGRITVRVQTVATVHGPARLIYKNDGVSRSVDLKDGIHTTRPLLVPLGFDHVTIVHDWKKGDAHLRALRAIWTYYTLV